MNLFKKKQKIGFNEFGEKLVDPSNTPISKYKNRRQMIINERRKQVQGTFENGSNRGSFIGKSITKLMSKDSSNSSTLEQQETGWINDMSMTKNEQLNLEKEENLIMAYFQKRIKIWSYATLALAAYVLLNVFIGFSSAPFYEKFAICNRYDPDLACKTL
jgi:hypothetical protein